MSLCIYRSLFLAIVKKVPAFGQLTVPSSFCKHTHRPLKRHYTEKERTNRFWRLQCRCMRGLFLPFPLLFPVFFVSQLGSNFSAKISNPIESRSNCVASRLNSSRSRSNLPNPADNIQRAKCSAISRHERRIESRCERSSVEEAK